ncbi:hypothetical protein CFOL_v3_34278 [Cephalotus follicularis]|uniref:Uncharacterized protein n=1 Tax=Cephalotus follicularis TaxID=3775 RepID=A0A1Q3DF54_CEPFO|nr:hypothetical protein CFOL_v3_34278 [Cephalotus follicularis]
MDLLAPEYSSGCESGWTLYFEHDSQLLSSDSHTNNTKFVDVNGDGYEGKCVKQEDCFEEEEDDLSMLSDASSGPPQYVHEHHDGYFNDDNGCQYLASKATTLPKNNGKRQKSKENRRRKDHQELPSFLDDTASSPVFNFSSKNNFALTNNQPSMESILDYSQGFSATHFQGTAAYQDHYGFLQSSLPENHFQNNQVVLKGNRMEMRLVIFANSY